MLYSASLDSNSFIIMASLFLVLLAPVAFLSFMIMLRTMKNGEATNDMRATMDRRMDDILRRIEEIRRGE